MSWFILQGGKPEVYEELCEQVPCHPGHCQTGTVAHYDEALKELVANGSPFMLNIYHAVWLQQIEHG